MNDLSNLTLVDRDALNQLFDLARQAFYCENQARRDAELEPIMKRLVPEGVPTRFRATALVCGQSITLEADEPFGGRPVPDTATEQPRRRVFGTGFIDTPDGQVFEAGDSIEHLGAEDRGEQFRRAEAIRAESKPPYCAPTAADARFVPDVLVEKDLKCGIDWADDHIPVGDLVERELETAQTASDHISLRDLVASELETAQTPGVDPRIAADCRAFAEAMTNPPADVDLSRHGDISELLTANALKDLEVDLRGAEQVDTLDQRPGSVRYMLLRLAKVPELLADLVEAWMRQHSAEITTARYLELVEEFAQQELGTRFTALDLAKHSTTICAERDEARAERDDLARHAQDAAALFREGAAERDDARATETALRLQLVETRKELARRTNERDDAQTRLKALTAVSFDQRLAEAEERASAVQSRALHEARLYDAANRRATDLGDELVRLLTNTGVDPDAATQRRQQIERDAVTASHASFVAPKTLDCAVVPSAATALQAKPPVVIRDEQGSEIFRLKEELRDVKRGQTQIVADRDAAQAELARLRSALEGDDLARQSSHYDGGYTVPPASIACELPPPAVQKEGSDFGRLLDSKVLAERDAIDSRRIEAENFRDAAVNEADELRTKLANADRWIVIQLAQARRAESGLADALRSIDAPDNGDLETLVARVRATLTRNREHTLDLEKRIDQLNTVGVKQVPADTTPDIIASLRRKLHNTAGHLTAALCSVGAMNDGDLVSMAQRVGGVIAEAKDRIAKLESEARSVIGNEMRAKTELADVVKGLDASTRENQRLRDELKRLLANTGVAEHCLDEAVQHLAANPVYTCPPHDIALAMPAPRVEKGMQWPSASASHAVKDYVDALAGLVHAYNAVARAHRMTPPPVKADLARYHEALETAWERAHKVTGLDLPAGLVHPYNAVERVTDATDGDRICFPLQQFNELEATATEEAARFGIQRDSFLSDAKSRMAAVHQTLIGLSYALEEARRQAAQLKICEEQRGHLTEQLAQHTEKLRRQEDDRLFGRVEVNRLRGGLLSRIGELSRVIRELDRLSCANIAGDGEFYFGRAFEKTRVRTVIGEAASQHRQPIDDQDDRTSVERWLAALAEMPLTEAEEFEKAKRDASRADAFQFVPGEGFVKAEREARTYQAVTGEPLVQAMRDNRDLIEPTGQIHQCGIVEVEGRTYDLSKEADRDVLVNIAVAQNRPLGCQEG